MAREKHTPRKRTGPKGVPRHQMAPRNDQASSSRSVLDEEKERLSKELTEATRDRMLNVVQIGQLQT